MNAGSTVCDLGQRSGLIVSDLMYSHEMKDLGQRHGVSCQTG